MLHEIVREAVERLGVGTAAPASNQIDTGLADIAFESILPHGNSRHYSGAYRGWGAYRPGKVRAFPDVRTAMQAVDSESARWQAQSSLSHLGGTMGAERDRAVRLAREVVATTVGGASDRETLSLAQRFKGSSKVQYAGDWQHGPSSWILVSQLLPDAAAYAVGTSLAHIGDELQPEVATRVATGLTLLRQAGVWAFRVDTHGEIACIPEPRVTLNIADEPHSEGEPAIQWPDGQEVWAYNGQIVPRAWIVEPERITRERLDTAKSLPVAEVMLSIYGPDRFVQEEGSILTEDEAGKLWHAAHPWQSSATWGAIPVNVRMVEVINSTPEPDGSSRTYWLRVPGTIRRPKEGVAWTFAIPEHEYRPVVET